MSFKKKIIIATTSFILLMIASTIIHGVVFSKLWEWFLVPTLNLPELGAAQCAGIGMILMYLSSLSHTGSQKSTKEKTLSTIVYYLLVLYIAAPLALLTMGYFISLFVR